MKLGLKYPVSEQIVHFLINPPAKYNTTLFRRSQAPAFTFSILGVLPFYAALRLRLMEKQTRAVET